MGWTPQTPVHAISQARILKWVAISFSGGSSQPRDQIHYYCCVSFITDELFTTEPVILKIIIFKRYKRTESKTRAEEGNSNPWMSSKRLVQKTYKESPYISKEKANNLIF